jgi:hypothetical protein
MVNAWLQAKAANDPQLQAGLARRFTPEYPSAFQAWLKTDPFTNPAAPAGPGHMPQYRNRHLEEARRLNDQASAADTYVRVTVLFALVLFLVAVGQRFRVRVVRAGANAVAFGLLAYGLYTVSTLPRL